MCDDYDDFNDSFDNSFDDGDNNDADFEDAGCEVDDLIGDDDDFGPASVHSEQSLDDCPDGMDWENFMMAVGLGYEMGLEEKRRKRLRDGGIG